MEMKDKIETNGRLNIKMTTPALHDQHCSTSFPERLATICTHSQSQLIDPTCLRCRHKNLQQDRNQSASSPSHRKTAETLMKKSWLLA